MSIIGYARVSTREQTLGSQEAKLREAGVERLFVDHGESSRRASRPGWDECRRYLRSGDVLMVTSLDRLAGTTTMALEIISRLGDDGVELKSLSEPAIDTTTPMGRALFGIVAVFEQLRVDMIRDATRRGLAHARTQGRVGGRPPVVDEDKRELIMTLRAAGWSHARIAKQVGVSASSVGRTLNGVVAERAQPLGSVRGSVAERYGGV
ncbi:MAG: recombinase family protein [Propionibacteriaceae bacterium]|nr:recombinase family protein [Propionibacteriaceae bacterium]